MTHARDLYDHLRAGRRQRRKRALLAFGAGFLIAAALNLLKLL